eukprot:scaffold16039_cov57-Phaeocystis_antarctica.AAC.2
MPIAGTNACTITPPCAGAPRCPGTPACAGAIPCNSVPPCPCCCNCTGGAELTSVGAAGVPASLPHWHCGSAATAGEGIAAPRPSGCPRARLDHSRQHGRHHRRHCGRDPGERPCDLGRRHRWHRRQHLHRPRRRRTCSGRLARECGLLSQAHVADIHVKLPFFRRSVNILLLFLDAVTFFLDAVRIHRVPVARPAKSMHENATRGVKRGTVCGILGQPPDHLFTGAYS